MSRDRITISVEDAEKLVDAMEVRWSSTAYGAATRLRKAVNEARRKWEVRVSPDGWELVAPDGAVAAQFFKWWVGPNAAKAQAERLAAMLNIGVASGRRVYGTIDPGVVYIRTDRNF